jgi:acyl carrier protein
VVAYGRLTADILVYARFHPQSHSTQRAVDIDVFDTASSRLLLHVESYLHRSVARGAFGSGTLPPPPVSAASNGHRPAAEPPLDRPDTTLTPDEGAEIFRQLLHAKTGPVVMVDVVGAIADGQPTAAAGAQDQPAAAPQPDVEAPAVTAEAPDNRDISGDLHGLWSSALGLTAIDPHADFFEIGGNSLAAVQLASRISTHFGIELGAGSLFDHSTIDALTREITELLAAGA